MQITTIPIPNLILSFMPVFVLLIVFVKWKLNWKALIWASWRMLSQLLIIGYFLTFIFQSKNPWWTSLIIIFMLGVSAWISLHSIKEKRREKFKFALASLFIGALPVLLLVTVVVIPNANWFDPRFFIPLAGMIFSKSMNTIGIAAERFESEIKTNSPMNAKHTSLSAALISEINTFLAVGLVSLPGMMTGQILSGIDPLLAVRYQIVVMTMVMGAGGLSAALFLQLSTNGISNKTA